MLAESREACRRIQKLRMLWKTVVAHRLKELRHLHALEKRADWSDRCDVHSVQWIHSPLPISPEETTASTCADVNALSKKIWMTETERSKQRVESFLNDLEQRTASLTEEEFARLERMIMERRGCAAAHVVVAQIGTAQPNCVVQKSCSMYMSVCRETPRAG